MSSKRTPVNIGLDDAADVTPQKRGVNRYFDKPETRISEDTDIRKPVPTDARISEGSQVRRPEKPDRTRFPKITTRVWPRYHDQFDDLVKRIQRTYRDKSITAEEVMEAMIAMSMLDVTGNPKSGWIGQWFSANTHLRKYEDTESEADFD